MVTAVARPPREDLVEEAWTRGNLQYLLRPYQRVMQQQAREAGDEFFALCSRRIGKSTTLSVVDSIEDSIRVPGHDTKIAFPTLLMAEKVIGEVIDPILRDCPERLRPRYNGKHTVFEFPNGSKMWLSGADNRRNADRLRGTSSHKLKLDEACHMAEFEYLLDSVLMPQLLTTDGSVWYMSTPPEATSHPSVTKYRELEEQGATITYTIWIAREWWTTPRILKFIEKAGGAASTKCRREYFAEIVQEEAIAVVPEWAEAKRDVVTAIERPKFFRPYVFADFGFNDMTAVVFSYWHWELARIVVEDELYFEGASGVEVGLEVRKKEIELYGEHMIPTRYADAPPQMLVDVARASGAYALDGDGNVIGPKRPDGTLPPKSLALRSAWNPVRKDDFLTSLNNMRTDVHNRTIAIHPRCVSTIAHMEGAIWNTNRTSYKRMPGFGHFDGVDAIRYQSRHVDRLRNPALDHASPVDLADHHVLRPAESSRKRSLGRRRRVA